MRGDSSPLTSTPRANVAAQRRGRLEVIAPESAARLASVPDAALVELLPPAPTDTSAPTDNSNVLWFELIKPLMSTSPERAGVHLQAFVNYAEHAQEQALYRAHIPPNAVMQRAAIADWAYWQHLSVLTSDAMATDASIVQLPHPVDTSTTLLLGCQQS